MSGNLLLDTATLAVSLFNTMLLLWLGIVVVSNSDRRSWGIWLASGGLLCGGVFFLIHTAIVARGLREASTDLDLLWHLGWLPIIASPLAWYVVMLWYAGFLGAQARQNPTLRTIHLPGTAFVLACAALLLVLVLVVGSLPTFQEVVTLGRNDYAASPGTPLLIIVYAIYNISCLGLAIHALRHPGPSARWMGELARQRARPWLVSASIVLLAVSLFVSVFVVVLYFSSPSWTGRDQQVRIVLAWFDLMIGAMIAIAVVLIGKATVSYEIFTGKTLPRRGFFRQWRRAVILAAGYSLLLAATIVFSVSPIYALLLATVLLVTFYALLSVRMFGERERVVSELRPFLSTLPDGQSNESLRAAFDSLCETVLNVRVAYLCPLVPFSSSLAYPSSLSPPSDVSTLAACFLSSKEVFIAISPEQFADAVWAIPLWSERGLLGMLLLGERKDASLYAQEEIEIAQATGERVLQAQASAELTRRLIDLQRGRLAATQVVDRRARRVLHDDILPQLHTAMLSLSAGDAQNAQTQITEVHRALSNLLREMPAGASPQIERYGVIGALQRAVEQEFTNAFDDVTWSIEPEAESHAQSLASLHAEVVYAAAREAIRNAAKHGRGAHKTRTLHLWFNACWQEGLTLEIQDDGVGVLLAANGAGQGLQLHSTMMAVIGGTLKMERAQEKTRVLLSLPLNVWN
jgi:signal transduction histidine kinase